MARKEWTLQTAIEQLESCNFTSDAGPLAHNDAFIWLQNAVRVGPEFLPGQGVYYEITATAAGETLAKWKHFYIVGCQMESDCESRFWLYDLSADPPGPYHYGTVDVKRVKGAELRLQSPADGK